MFIFSLHQSPFDADYWKIISFQFDKKKFLGMLVLMSPISCMQIHMLFFYFSFERIKTMFNALLATIIDANVSKVFD